MVFSGSPIPTVPVAQALTIFSTSRAEKAEFWPWIASSNPSLIRMVLNYFPSLLIHSNRVNSFKEIQFSFSPECMDGWLDVSESKGLVFWFLLVI